MAQFSLIWASNDSFNPENVLRSLTKSNAQVKLQITSRTFSLKTVAACVGEPLHMSRVLFSDVKYSIDWLKFDQTLYFFSIYPTCQVMHWCHRPSPVCKSINLNLFAIDVKRYFGSNKVEVLWWNPRKSAIVVWRRERKCESPYSQRILPIDGTSRHIWTLWLFPSLDFDQTEQIEKIF